MNSDPHVIPKNDLRPHILSSGCACKPFFSKPDEVVITIHNSFDGRERGGRGEPDKSWECVYLTVYAEEEQV